MLKRYPHTVQLVFPGELSGEDTGIVGPGAKDYIVTVQGRMEISDGNKAYAAIFFTNQSADVRLFEDRDAKIVWRGREYNVGDIIPYQTHTEIWLASMG